MGDFKGSTDTWTDPDDTGPALLFALAPDCWGPLTARQVLSWLGGLEFSSSRMASSFRTRSAMISSSIGLSWVAVSAAKLVPGPLRSPTPAGPASSS